MITEVDTQANCSPCPSAACTRADSASG